MKSTKSETRNSLELAIKRIQGGMPRVIPTGRKISIASVAREAGVSNATIHNRYPDIAEKIRNLGNNSSADELRANRDSLKKYQNKLIQIRKELEQLKADLAKSQSINLRLLKENELLRMQVPK